MAKIIGIDLGTTNSCVALMEGNNVKVLESNEGNRTTPSIVAYTDNDEVLVGVSAKRQLVTNPNNTLTAIKRVMGRKYHEIDFNRETYAFKLVAHSNGDAWIQLKKKLISPQQVSAEILKAMKHIAETYIGMEVKDAIVTVPAYFNDAQRQATKDAGTIAGLHVKRIINEPTAAALAFGLDKRLEANSKVIVYDLGGGTFDVSIIDITSIDGEKQFEVLATNGDTFLGGEDFDNRIVAHMKAWFKQREGHDLSMDALCFQRMKEAAERAKIELSNLKETCINLPYITTIDGMPKHLNMGLTRAKLDSMVEDLVDRTLTSCSMALRDAQLEAHQINDVIMVGGMTRMPIIRARVSEFFKRMPKFNINPDEAVAIGAAIQGQVLSGNRKDVLLLDVIPLSLGIETLGGVMVKLIQKNSTLPTKHSQVFSTAEDNQTSVTIKVFQGEREFVAHNKLLGEFNLDGIQPAPKGAPQIEVTFDVDANAILNVTAQDKSTGLKNNVVIKSSTGLSQSEIEQMVKDAELNAQGDQKRKILIEARNHADETIARSEKLLKETTAPTQGKASISNHIQQLKAAMESDDASMIRSLTDQLTEKLTEASSMQPGAKQS